MWHSCVAMKTGRTEDVASFSDVALKAGVKAERIMKKVNSLKNENIYSSSGSYTLITHTYNGQSFNLLY